MDVPKRKRRNNNARKPSKDEEMAWAPPRNRSDWPDWEEARMIEESEWRLEPEGEAEVPEIIIVSDVVVNYKEAFELVAQDEAEKVSIVQEIMLGSTDYLRRIMSQCPT